MFCFRKFVNNLYSFCKAHHGTMYFKNQKLKISALKKVTFSEILICNLVYALFYKSKKNNWQIAVGRWKSETNNNKVFINHRITETSDDKLLLQKENENTALVFNL